jgi:hypothetical protein
MKDRLNRQNETLLLQKNQIQDLKKNVTSAHEILKEQQKQQSKLDHQQKQYQQQAQQQTQPQPHSHPQSQPQPQQSQSSFGNLVFFYSRTN